MIDNTIFLTIHIHLNISFSVLEKNILLTDFIIKVESLWYQGHQ